MAKDAVWGGNLELAAMCRVLKTHITIYQFQAPRFEIRNHEHPDCGTIHVAYHDQQHYSSIRAIGDASHAAADIEAKAPKAPKSIEERKEQASTEKSETMVMQLTGCPNRELVRAALHENFHDVDATVEYLIAVRESGDEEFYGPAAEVAAALEPPPSLKPKPSSNSAAVVANGSSLAHSNLSPRPPADGVNGVPPSLASSSPAAPSPSSKPAAVPAPPAPPASPPKPAKKLLPGNEPCPCGSEKKKKKCCGSKARQAALAAAADESPRGYGKKKTSAPR